MSIASNARNIVDNYRALSGICAIVSDATILTIWRDMYGSEDNEIVDALQEEERMALASAASDSIPRAELLVLLRELSGVPATMPDSVILMIWTKVPTHLRSIVISEIRRASFDPYYRLPLLPEARV